MTQAIIITGTNTDCGKTVFAAALTAAIDGCYWKPIQCGLEDETDSQTVRRLAGLGPERILPEAYLLKTPASPHFAAEQDGIEIDATQLVVPRVARPLVIEGAGGLAVPIRRDFLQIELFARWKLPVVLCASTRVGTINHSLLSIEALKRRAIPILGVAFIGDANSDSETTICAIGGVKRLGCLPRLEPLNSASLLAAFNANFKLGDVLGLGGGGP
jgi:dethiobiotin synthetase